MIIIESVVLNNCQFVEKNVEKLFEHFEHQLIKGGLVDKGEPLMGFLDADLAWNRRANDCNVLELLFRNLSINSILFARPAEPYRTIIDYLAETSGGIIYPEDCETRTFLHDLPVTPSLNPESVIPILKQRKSVIIPGRGIITYGSVSLEQAFVTFSSVCFASFVKFFSDYLSDFKNGNIQPGQQSVFDKAIKYLGPMPVFNDPLKTGPFDTEENVNVAMNEAGKLTVSHRLVDSFFGNISYLHGDTLYISQTGSSLDNLAGCIDPCPLSGSSCASITASSELMAHMEVIKKTGHRAILHGHPKFSVILSMDCGVEGCEAGSRCYLSCPHERDACGIPIVPGEVGTGVFGLCNTVPAAIKDRPGVIVYGHGLFTTAAVDFNIAFKNLLEIENKCRQEYFRRVGNPQ